MPTVVVKEKVKKRLDLLQADEVVKSKGEKKRSLSEIIEEALDIREQSEKAKK